MLLVVVCAAGGLSAACGDASTSKEPQEPLLDGCEYIGHGSYECALEEGCPGECCEDGVIRRCITTPFGSECFPSDVEDCGGGRCVELGGVCTPDGGQAVEVEDAGCVESFDCTAQMPCCDDTGDLIYVQATCCGDDGFPSCPEGYDYSQCSPDQRCADSPSPLPDCFDGCGQPAEPICEHQGERDVWECPTAPDAGADCADAG